MFTRGDALSASTDPRVHYLALGGALLTNAAWEAAMAGWRWWRHQVAAVLPHADTILYAEVLTRVFVVMPGQSQNYRCELVV